MSVSPECVLLGDIGATNARLAIVTGSSLGPITNFEIARFPRFTDLVDLFLRDPRIGCQLSRALFAIAAPINGERSRLTNAQWVIDTAELRSLFGLQSRLLNDFEAVAHSLPLLGSADSTKIGGGVGEENITNGRAGSGYGVGGGLLGTAV
jgi:glucokinase